MLAMAIAFQRPVYDCLYVALAVLSRAPMITADERLVHALGSRYPVRWLGSWRFGRFFIRLVRYAKMK